MFQVTFSTLSAALSHTSQFQSQWPLAAAC